MKKVIVGLTILFMSILEGESFSEMGVFNKEGILLIDYTMHLKQPRAMKRYAYIYPLYRKTENGRIKTYEIVKGLCNELVSEGYTRIPANYPVPPRRESTVNVIQKEEGININNPQKRFREREIV